MRPLDQNDQSPFSLLQSLIGFPVKAMGETVKNERGNVNHLSLSYLSTTNRSSGEEGGGQTPQKGKGSSL